MNFKFLRSYSLCLLVLTGLVLFPLPPVVSAASPDQIQISIQGAWLSKDDLEFESISPPAASVGLARSLRALFGSSSTVPTGRYRVLKLEISDISWSVTFSPSNLSPCPSDPNPSALGSVDLGGNSEFYFKTADLGGSTLRDYRENPPDPGTGYPGDFNHPFLLGAPIDVHKDSTTAVDLVIGVEDTLTCDSLLVFDPDTMDGINNGNISPVRFIMGSSAQTPNITGVLGDSTRNEIFISQDNPARVSVFPLFGSGNIPSGRVLEGPATRLNHPAGLSAYFDPSDPVFGGELFVANYGNDSITAYNLGIFSNANDPFPLTGTPNLEPKRFIGGLYSGINKPRDIFYDPILDEIIVLNEGNQTVTSHSRLSDKNSIPRKTISDEFIVNSSNNIVLINEAGGEGTVKVFIPEGRYSTGSDLAFAFTQRFLPVLTPGTDLLVLFDSISGLFDISVLTLGTGVVSVEFLWSSPVTTASDFLGFDSGGDSGPLTAGMGIVSNSPHLTAFDQPCGVMSDPSGAEIVVSNRGDDSLVFFSRNADINDRVFPLRILKGPLTGLDEPCGLRWDPVNDLILVANKGNNSIRFFDPSLIIGTADIAPVKVLAGNLTNLEQIAGLDLVNGELIVGGPVGDSLLEVQVAGIPQMTITSSRPDSVASSPLFGNYNTILFGVDYGGVNLNGIPVPVVTSERGEVDFDPSGFDPNLNWPFFTSNLVTRITREVIEPDCTVVYAEGAKTGFYGTKANGGFFATLPGINGSFQGSVSGDGAFFSAVMIDHPTKHRVLIGMRNTGGVIPFLTGNGMPGGAPAEYAWGSYLYDVFAIGRPLENDSIQIKLAIEMGFMESPSGDRVFLGAAGDSNILTILNPLGLVRDPNSPGPIFRPGVGSITATDTVYQTFTGGGFEHDGAGLGGAVLDGGSAIGWMRNTNILDTGVCETELGADIGFGLGFRQKPAGTFSVSSFQGRYILAAIGDRYDRSDVNFKPLSSYQELWFDGSGTVEVEMLSNEAGKGEGDRISLDYRVTRKITPEFGDFQKNIDVIEMFFRGDQSPFASALIGRNGDLLTFYRNLDIEKEGNLTRLLGAAIKVSD